MQRGKNEVYKNGYRRRSCTSKTAKIHRFVRFVMYCIITTVPVAFYRARSDNTVLLHGRNDEICDEIIISLQIWRNGEFLRFQICNSVAYNRFYKLRFYRAAFNADAV